VELVGLEPRFRNRREFMDVSKLAKLRKLLKELEAQELSTDLSFGSMAKLDPNRQNTLVKLANLRRWIATLKDVLG